MTVITIDGPAAAGKGTLARAISSEYGLPYLDTGLLFRATARRVLDTAEDPVKAAQAFQDSDLGRDGLRTAAVSQEASRVSAIPEVRQALKNFQKAFVARPEGAVLDGRDTGTAICPTADLKLFVTASLESRAQRRFAELQASGDTSSFEDVLEEMRIRDERDANRAVDPMRPAADGVVIDTSNLTAEEVLEHALELVDRVIATRAKVA